MPEVSAPAAPAAPTSAPAGAPPVARNNSGQFSPKDGAQSVPPPAAKPVAPPKPGEAAPPVEKKAEPWRVKRKVGDREFDLDEAGLDRHLGELEWRRKQQNEITAMKRELDEVIRLAKTDEDGLFKKLGVDVDGRAERILAERLRLAGMTPEQQELEQARAELERGKKEVQTERERIAAAQKQAQRTQLQEQNRVEYQQALEHSVMPHSRAKLFLMTQIQKGQRDSGGPKLAPEQLGKAYDELMLSAFDELVRSSSTKPEVLARWPDLPKLATASLEKLDGAALLQALGPALKRKVLMASVAEHNGQQTIPIQQQAPSTQRPPSQPGGFDEVELEQRKRDFLKQFK